MKWLYNKKITNEIITNEIMRKEKKWKYHNKNNKK